MRKISRRLLTGRAALATIAMALGVRSAHSKGRGTDASSPTPPVGSTSFTVHVGRPGTNVPLSPTNPFVVLVRNELDANLDELTVPEAAPSIVEATLHAAFPGLVTSESESFQYGWVRINGEWVWICTGWETFYVQLATVVEVRVEVTTKRED